MLSHLLLLLLLIDGDVEALGVEALEVEVSLEGAASFSDSWGVAHSFPVAQGGSISDGADDRHAVSADIVRLGPFFTNASKF